MTDIRAYNREAWNRAVSQGNIWTLPVSPEAIAQARQALSDGVPLKGYFVWSLMDNFEWACGFARRFGVIYTDYATQRRIIKDSGRFLAQMAAG